MIQIEPAHSTDLDDLQDLYLASIRGTCTNDYNPDQISAWCASVENKERWFTKIQSQYFLKAVSGSDLVGMASLEGTDYLDFMYVHPRHQKQGLALALLRRIEDEAGSRGAVELMSDVSHTARPFFLRNGFRVIKENHLEVRGVRLSNWRMIKLLGH